MTVASNFSVELDSTSLEKVKDSLLRLGSKGLSEAAYLAVGNVANRTYLDTVDAMIAGINLSPDVVRAQTDLSLSTTPNLASATIRAFNTQARPSTLSSFGAVVVSKAAKTKSAKGNASIGVGRGYKAVGFDVSVRRGKTDFFSHSKSGNTYFFIIRAPNGKLLTVRRQKEARGKGSLATMRGPSVVQLFKFQINTHIAAITTDLQQTLLVKLQDELDNL